MGLNTDRMDRVVTRAAEIFGIEVDNIIVKVVKKGLNTWKDGLKNIAR